VPWFGGDVRVCSLAESGFWRAAQQASGGAQRIEASWAVVRVGDVPIRGGARPS